jgi:RNA polymerase sigma-70 factor (ECF subfamily)
MRSGAPRTPRGSIEGFDDLIAAARAGRPEAWERLYHWLAPTVAGYLRMQGARDVDDVTSETFLAVFRNIRTFGGTEAQFRSWVFVIAHRRLQDERRRFARRPAPADSGSFDESAATLASPLDTADEVLRALATARVVEVCDQLPSEQRTVLLLRIIGDLTVDQVAEVLDKSPGAVKQLQRRAFEAVRTMVEREGVTL